MGVSSSMSVRSLRQQLRDEVLAAMKDLDDGGDIAAADVHDLVYTRRPEVAAQRRNRSCVAGAIHELIGEGVVRRVGAGVYSMRREA